MMAPDEAGWMVAQEMLRMDSRYRSTAGRRLWTLCVAMFLVVSSSVQF